MKSKEIIKGQNRNNIKVTRIETIKDFLFIELENDQRILTNGKDIYDISEYNVCKDIFMMDNRLCAVLRNFYSSYLVDLNKKEILFGDDNVYYICKQDERMLYIIRNVGDNLIYDIKTKKFLTTLPGYKFEEALENELYTFCEETEDFKEFHTLKRIVINANGKTLLEDVEGYVSSIDNHLIISKENELVVVKINEDKTMNFNSIKKGGAILAKPEYYDGKIIVIETNNIKIYNMDFELINQIKVDGVEEILDLQAVGDVLKLLIPYQYEGQKINKHIFVNLKNNKVISHVRIEGYPYWTPKTFVGRESIEEDDIKSFSFYDQDFNLITTLSATYCEDAIGKNEEIFLLKTVKEKEVKKQMINATSKMVMDAEYDIIHMNIDLPYGYGVDLEKEQMDFFDSDFNVLFPNFNYKKYGLNIHSGEFTFFISNNYICIIDHILDGYGRSIWKTIIQKNTGEIILDSYNHKCRVIGDFFQIISENDNQFLNTVTGEIGELNLLATPDENGKINISELDFSNNSLKLGNSNNLLQAGDYIEQFKRKLKKD